MGLSPKLEMRHGQQLVMTPQLQQAIRLLQYSNMEVAAFVETELERNPLLEHDDADEPAERFTEPVAETASVGEDPGLERLELSTLSAAAEDSVDSDASALYPDATPTELANGETAVGSDSNQSSGWETLTQRNGNSDGDLGGDFEDQLTASLSLKDHLLAQAGLALPDRVDHLIGLHLIDMVDEAGYIDGDVSAVAEKLGIDRCRAERVLAVLQGFDPTETLFRKLFQHT